MQEHELSDGGVLELEDNGTIRRRDVHGNCEEIRRPDEEGHSEWLSLFSCVRLNYEDGLCPDCQEDISYNAVDGESCENCGHVFCKVLPVDDAKIECTIWIVEDWAGNRMFPDKEFASFDDGLAFVQDKFPNEEDLQEIYVVKKKD